MCNSTDEKLSTCGFVDDTNMLAYSQSTEEICRTIERAHARYLGWTAGYGTSFAPKTYELIHLSRKARRFNMQAQLQLGAGRNRLSTLGVWLDPRLHCGGSMLMQCRRK